MEKRRRITICFITIAVVSMVVCVLETIKINHTFTPKHWKATTAEKRYRYLDSFQEQYEIKGLDSKQIIELLGEPTTVLQDGDDLFNKYHDYEDEGVDMYYYYRIQDNVISGWKIFLIGFKDDAVIDGKVGIEDW